MTTLLSKAKNMLKTDETILFYVACSLDIFIYRSVARPGLLILTNKRLFFYGPDVSKNPLFEEYAFAKISNLKENSDFSAIKLYLCMIMNGKNKTYSNK